MKVKSKLKIDKYVLIDGKKQKYDIAYDMSSTIGVEVEDIQSDEVEFV